VRRKLTNNEQVRSLGNSLAGRSAVLADNLESFSAGHAAETAGERDKALKR
jgi:hypothetical protein